MAAAMQWVARIFAAAIVMTLPGLGGRHLDQRWGTTWIGAVGFVLGLVGGMAYLIVATRSAEDSSKPTRRGPSEADAKRFKDE